MMSEPNDVYVDYAKMKAERDALAAQRDEGLAREAELVEALRSAKCHIANAQFALSKENPVHSWLPHIRQGLSDAKELLAKHGCADGEKAE